MDIEAVFTDTLIKRVTVTAAALLAGEAFACFRIGKTAKIFWIAFGLRRFFVKTTIRLAITDILTNIERGDVLISRHATRAFHKKVGKDEPEHHSQFRGHCRQREVQFLGFYRP